MTIEHARILDPEPYSYEATFKPLALLLQSAAAEEEQEAEAASPPKRGRLCDVVLAGHVHFSGLSRQLALVKDKGFILKSPGKPGG